MTLSESDSPPFRAGRLLVASPQLADGNFFRAVVLLLEHSPEGALGVVLNRPTQIAALDVLPDHLLADLPLDRLIHEGGPVSPEAVIMLGEFRETEGVHLTFGEVGVIDPDADLERLGERLRRVRVFGGYAGWSAGQLESELEQEAWIDAEPVTDDVFGEGADALWGSVLERKGGQYALVARMPEDPSLN